MRRDPDLMTAVLKNPDLAEALATLRADTDGHHRDGEPVASITRCETVVANEPSGDALHGLPLTDSGNAERFERLCGGRFRYSAPEHHWYAWNGKRWETDRTGRAMDETKRVARAIDHEAGDTDDQQRRTDVRAWARRSESHERRRAMLTLAQGEGAIPITPDQWDRNPWLFNCLSGTIDLRTGELLCHNKVDLITRIALVEYDPETQSELWEQFLRDLTGKDREFINFLQRAVGYSLTGDTREEVLFMPLGPGGTGKSTFLESVRGVMGDYARTSDFETFVRKHGEGPRNDIAALAGRRMVVSIEVEEGKRLAEGMLKSITGRDTISARFLYQEGFEFKPQFKLWLAANDPPEVRHADDAIWRRILRLPFDHVVPAEKRDPTLKERLCAMPDCQKAILAWTVKGALEWYEEGLAVPERIRKATRAYREEQNPLLEFLDDSCERGSDLEVASGRLFASYEAWCTHNGVQPIGPRRFATALQGEGFQKTRTNSFRGWQGIGLKVTGDG
jgi:putative DNA primase/helicase